ncbi:hypothetical protein [Methyloprofundus sedimenti]|uniref:hypothetical protein n=1 Tax=Methyloprofundus sedimenti TaxID=1420851 RepID=UPI001301D41E|nr:hypothetical protein [Methyloprofundus sedimenti]
MQELKQDLQSSDVDVKEQTQISAPREDLPFEDERYPGSFFKVPGAPISSKTSWRIS